MRAGEILAWAGDDPERLRGALEAEQGGKRRPTLVRKLAAKLNELGAPARGRTVAPPTGDVEPEPEPELEPRERFFVATERYFSGRPKTVIEAESRVAAAHWDPEVWQ